MLNRAPPKSANQLPIVGSQPEGTYGTGLVIVHFTVTADGKVDPQTIEVRAGDEKVPTGISTLTPRREMISEAKAVAGTCLYKPALKDGQPVEQVTVAGFIITRNR